MMTMNDGVDKRTGGGGKEAQRRHGKRQHDKRQCDNQPVRRKWGGRGWTRECEVACDERAR